ncbi:xenobiotic-transporting ATPase [Fictibacillus macauensis ZFHKF-1]|uniref:Xenobiotic-transporting ATPase n=1 Tax=Fictibacillus macauensis ZFHKF-1 TaxID=1196324 RepID=I8IXP6_9BACL|nr:ABC transporter ATP-binding protein [Fictibacillus macauensis]EIT84261.1 xenobiotic-transporting ATPase [Fictibacillus macauensis ZFHKF-1]
MKSKDKPVLWRVELIPRFKAFRGKMLLLCLLTTIGAGLATVPPLLIGTIVDELSGETHSFSLSQLCVSLFFIIILCELVSVSRQYFAAVLSLDIVSKLRTDMLEVLPRKDLAFYSTTPRGEILQWFTDDLQEVQRFSLETVPQFLYETVLAIGGLCIIAYIYWPFLFIVVAIYVMYIGPLHYFGSIQRKTSAKLSHHKAMLRQKSLQNFEAMKQIKLLGTEEKEREGVEQLHTQWAKLLQARYQTMNRFKNFPRVLDALAPALLFAVGGWQVFAGELTIGDLVIVTGYVTTLNAPLRSYSATFLGMKDIEKRLVNIARWLAGKNKEDDRLFPPLRGNIEFRNVWYEVEQKPILKNVSFTIHAGEHVAIVGLSGSGKSTVLRLLAKLFERYSGEITIDSFDLKQYTYRSTNIGFVTQSPFLFNGTIDDNLKWMYRTSIDERETLLRDLNVSKDIMLQNEVGENGSLLSGGQKQRIAVARTILSQPDFVLLDEVTSSLDRTNEVNVMNALTRAFQHKTMLFIAHKLETVVYAQRILVFHEGELVEEGTHEQLVERDGHYRMLWEHASVEQGVNH